jgi:hypothetical protein
MAVFKDLLAGARIATAGRKRKCYHDPKHFVSKGEKLLETKKQMAWHGYCHTCAKEMIRKARLRLDHLENELP